MTILDSHSSRVGHDHLLDGARPSTELAGFLVPQPLPITRTTARCTRPYQEPQRIRLLVREQAAEIVAAMGPAALEIIADFRARRWAFTADDGEDPIGTELARARAAEWHRIATSVSTLMTL
ncbi:hypothetical protein [Prauserella flavalba]|nr:hypothetical protein [Prauserella flavalba]